MKKILRYAWLGGLLILSNFQIAKAQSSNAPGATFSQYHYTPFITNPAMLASNSNIQFVMNYRRQPTVAGASFDTFMGSVIYPIFNKTKETRLGGIGVSFINDNNAGFIKTTGGVLGGGYDFHVGKHSIALGGQFGYFQATNDSRGVTTRSQYVNGAYDPNSELKEVNFLGTKSYVTFGVGAHWDIEDEKDREIMFFGVSYMNLNQPKLDLVEQTTGATSSVINPAIQASGGIRVLHTSRFAIMPTFRYTMAAGKYQANIGSWFRYHLSESQSVTGLLRDGEVGLGVWYNTNKFGVVSLEFNQPHYLLSLSYDLPFGQDVSAINSNGIFEVTGAFKLNRHTPRVAPPSKDSDGDGIFDENDACPQVPGKREFIGCPDTDNDGIPDDHDNCPNDPGLKEFAGCPDKDGDGITDAKDLCPTEPGTKETQGCPDRDGDHVPDNIDECPDKPGLAVDKGCPKEIPPVQFQEAKVSDSFKELLKAARFVHFETGTGKIEKTSYSILNVVADIMVNNYGDKSLQLEGHTDDIGEADMNLKLSVSRAEAVKAYLVSKGMKAENIITVGKGEAEPDPEHPNINAENRAVNRRVEMKVLEKK